jgi:hypothetical protein
MLQFCNYIKKVATVMTQPVATSSNQTVWTVSTIDQLAIEAGMVVVRLIELHVLYCKIASFSICYCACKLVCTVSHHPLQFLSVRFSLCKIQFDRAFKTEIQYCPLLQWKWITIYTNVHKSKVIGISPTPTSRCSYLKVHKHEIILNIFLT